MRAVLQRVKNASVRVEGKVVGAVQRGWLVLLGVGAGDDQTDVDLLADKVANLRAFPDAEDKMNLSVLDVGGGVLVVSQFTLFGDCRKGRRPSFTDAAPPDVADRLYQSFMQHLVDKGLVVQSGVFQAMMEVELLNEGPVTLLLDSKKLF